MSVIFPFYVSFFFSSLFDVDYYWVLIYSLASLLCMLSTLENYRRQMVLLCNDVNKVEMDDIHKTSAMSVN